MAEGKSQRITIGITTRRGDADWVDRYVCNYINVVAEYGATPVVLTPDCGAQFADGTRFEPDDEGRLPAEVLDRLDGLILSGGGDVHPRYFGAQLNGANPAAIDVRRDELELGLAGAALDRDMPVFGICRGCQVLNVAAGGAMVQDFDGHRSPKVDPFYHDVLVEADSRLHAILGETVVPVNTYHHQGLDEASLAPDFVPAGSARPDDWLIEAIESDRHRWLFGVQWHPERLGELSTAHRRLWDSYFSACADEDGAV